MSPKKLGRYDLIRVLGKGAMGLVYEGRDPNLDRRVAIKTIKVENLSAESAAEYEVRFRTEARSAARLQHPNIVSVYDSDRDGDIAFLVMEFIQGDDLKHHLDNGELYTLEQALRIMEDLLSALGYAHLQAIVHRDIKPANLLIEPGGRVKLTDFGVARIQDSGDVTRTQGTIVGTLKYMSPEQLQGRPIDARADLFAAGVVLYQLLTGKRPFDGDTDFAVIQQIVSHNPAAPTSCNPRLPRALDAVVAQSLAKSRDERFPTAQAFVAALQAACREAEDPTVVPLVNVAGSAGASGNATWTKTLRAGESLLYTQPGGSAGTSTSIVTQELELVYWKDIKDSVDIEEFQGFLLKFPAGIYADLARRRLRKLNALPDQSDIGFRPGNVTQPGFSSEGGSLDGAVLAPPRPPASAAADASLPAWQALETTVAKSPGRPAAVARPALLAGAGQAQAAADLAHDPDATRQGSTSLQSSRPVLPEEEDDASLPLLPAPAAAAARPNLRRVCWGLAGLAVLAGMGVAFKFSSRTNPEAGLAAVTTAPVVSAPLSAASTPPAAAAAAVTAPTPASTTAGPAAAIAELTAAASAAAAATAANAKKAALEKKMTAERKIAAEKKVAAEREKPIVPVQEKLAAPAAAPMAERAAPLSAGNPRQACEDRMLLGFQICMTEQCAKPVFTRHPVCLERRAMDQRRREAEQMNR